MPLPLKGPILLCRSRMPATTCGQLTVEKTPSYLVSGRVVERIFAMDPDVRLLVVVRDPVTRAVSDYTQAATKRPDIAPFEQLAFVARNLTNSELGLYAVYTVYTCLASIVGHCCSRRRRLLYSGTGKNISMVE